MKIFNERELNATIKRRKKAITTSLLIQKYRREVLQTVQYKNTIYVRKASIRYKNTSRKRREKLLEPYGNTENKASDKSCEGASNDKADSEESPRLR